MAYIEEKLIPIIAENTLSKEVIWSTQIVVSTKISKYIKLF